MIIIIILLFFLSFCAYAVMWTLQFHYRNSIFSRINHDFWDPEMRWVNKWRWHSNGSIMTKNNGKKIERFPGSSTIFVWTTDAFHLFQFIFLNSLILATSFLTDGKVVYNYPVQWWQALLAIRLIYAIVFNGLFGWLLIKK